MQTILWKERCLPMTRCNCNCNGNSSAALLKEITEVSFAVTDIHLFLDTHPCNQEALAYFQKMSKRRGELMAEYARTYGPLTIDDADLTGQTTWEWVEQPFPWEQKGGR
jgi:spore coat protein JB